MDTGLLAILFLLGGLLLFVLEVFIPSGGMISTVAILCIVGALWSAWSQWYETDPGLWWAFLSSTIVLIPASLIGAFWLLPRTAFGRKILLEGPDASEVMPFAEEAQHLHALVGQTGRTLSMLNPGGLVEVAGERQHCESEGLIVERGTLVQVVGHRGNCLIVRPIDSASDSAGLTEQPPGADPDDAQQLDFDLPQG